MRLFCIPRYSFSRIESYYISGAFYRSVGKNNPLLGANKAWKKAKSTLPLSHPIMSEEDKGEPPTLPTMPKRICVSSFPRKIQHTMITILFAFPTFKTRRVLSPLPGTRTYFPRMICVAGTTIQRYAVAKYEEEAGSAILPSVTAIRLTLLVSQPARRQSCHLACRRALPKHIRLPSRFSATAGHK